MLLFFVVTWGGGNLMLLFVGGVEAQEARIVPHVCTHTVPLLTRVNVKLSSFIHLLKGLCVGRASQV
jgi:hypothetical protein